MVEKIHKHRGDVGAYEYVIEWKGYKEKTWEPENNILDDLVETYLFTMLFYAYTVLMCCNTYVLTMGHLHLH
jgi:hypothetical protein